MKRTEMKRTSTLKRRRKPKGDLLTMDLDGFDLSKHDFPALCFARGRKIACGGKIDLHHVIEKQRLRREVPAEFGAQLRAKRDARNLLPCCRDHHGLIHTGSIRVEPSDLPAGFAAFVADYDLHGQVPRHLQTEQVEARTPRRVSIPVGSGPTDDTEVRHAP